ncbi:hypothetical protein L218DRAFT_959258 [Marasmius fiardii PR-910]|nr:hypothetical protein L218DRAFT_959258 [Marasmius fiardii PR-910]
MLNKKDLLSTATLRHPSPTIYQHTATIIIFIPLSLLSAPSFASPINSTRLQHTLSGPVHYLSLHTTVILNVSPHNPLLLESPFFTCN